MKSRLYLPVLLIIALGCGSKVKLVPVSGTVTLDDKPLSNVKIITQPIGKGDDLVPGPGSFAVTDAEGRFTLELQSEPRPGAIPGEHVIRMNEMREQKASSDDTASPADYRTVLPASCRDGSLKFTVPPTGTDQMNFHLRRRRNSR